MISEKNIVDNLNERTEKKIWSMPSFENINKSKIKHGGNPAIVPEGVTMPTTSYNS